ncbi:MAG: hypothetical protein OQK48_08035 [Sulfurimonas sp.]|uniref:hypothetical protein n=1 Tax=Sulfurimonas sp. TaxID=2022749 RepID=UPI00262766CA|nr:hypothetical protein [Sulfurimonas sp.]MCW8895157.1 hypothetical protein [Sulfurimonas sp.]MCW8954882.1 hypothetical protein [Sulfurimonas sp.]MCW9068301.1 hypothetical protein [Sulfurimonas sp.]
MDVSSGTGSVSAQVDVMKKAAEVQEQQVLKVLEGIEKESQDTQQKNVAQKTGVGNSVDIMS